MRVVREVTREEGNQCLACLEKKQYFNLETPEETAGAPQTYANHMQSYGNLESKPALPPTRELGLREPQNAEGAPRQLPSCLCIFMTA